MNDNIQVINKNGDIMMVEGISYIGIAPTNKKYLFYTLNEKVDNDLTKLYIAEVSDTEVGANPISDEEWDDIRKRMVKISHKEELDDISYYNFGEGNFHVGEAKKLAVTAVAKQAFKDAQATHTISVNQTETPVVTGQSTFFQAEEAPTTVPPQPEATTNIFTNPPAPVSEPIESAPVAAPVMGGGLPQAGQAETSIQQPGTPTEAPIVEQIESVPVMEEAPAVESSIPESTSTEGGIQNIDQKEIISDEDALKAIEVIQDYIAQEEAA